MSIPLAQWEGASLKLSNTGSPLPDGELLRHSQEVVVQSEDFRCFQDNEEAKMCLAAMKSVASRHKRGGMNPNG